MRQMLTSYVQLLQYQRGHTWDIPTQTPHEEDVAACKGPSNPFSGQYRNLVDDPVRISRAEFLEQHIGEYVQRSRPSGLPTLVNPWVITEVFREQSKHWHDLAKHHLEQIFLAVRNYAETIVGNLVDSRTYNLLMLNLIQPDLDSRWQKVEAKLEELLVPYTKQDPITYDPNFLRDLENIRSARSMAKADQNANSRMYHLSSSPNSKPRVSVTPAQRLLTESLDDFTNSEILDLMQTYYKVSAVLKLP